MKRRDRLRKAGARVRPSWGVRPGRSVAWLRSEKVSVRRANLADIGFIGQLSGKVFSVYGPYQSLVPGWFESNSTITFVAVEKGKPVGFAMMGSLLNESLNENRCELLAIAVSPAVRRRGIGRMLLREMEREADRLNEHILFLHTATDNTPAQGLFKKIGFTSLSLKKHFYPSGQDAVMMMKVI
jgi:ribosomal protein S18 acetylase RimI-like enzyme